MVPPDTRPLLSAFEGNDVTTGFLQHRVGDLLKGRYEVLSRLGSGAFGSVYRVLDRAVGVELACKEMHVLNDPTTREDERETALELFRREAQTLATLRHPHVPAAYYDAEEGTWQVCPLCGYSFEDAKFCPQHGTTLIPVVGRFYLMMDYISGPTLEELVGEAAHENRLIEEAQALEWIEGIAGALRALHRVGIVHRDVKPENIKVRNSDGAAILLDFGLTRKSHEAGGYGTVARTKSGRLGTQGYAPPDAHEQLSPDARSDIHALGMTLVRLLTGREPNDSDDLAQLRARPLRAFNSALSPAVEHLIQKAIASDREQRFADMDALIEELQSLTGGAALGLRQPPFTFANGARARTPSELSRLVETHATEATNYLFNGMFAQWLRAGGFAAGALAAEQSVETEKSAPMRALELFRRALAPGTPPRLVVEPRELDFGEVPSGAQVTRELRLRNAGAGYLWGGLAVQGSQVVPGEEDSPVGLSVPSGWDGNEAVIAVTLDTTGLEPGEERGILRVLPVVSGAGPSDVAWRYQVQALGLVLEPATLDFGEVPIGQSKPLMVRVRRADKGHGGIARGTIYGGDNVGPVEYPAEFEGDEEWVVRVNGTRSGTLVKAYESALYLTTNGGRLRLPLRYQVVLPTARVRRLLASAVGAGALSGLLLRGLSIVWSFGVGWRWLVLPRAYAASGTGGVMLALPYVADGSGSSESVGLIGSAPGLILLGALLGLGAGLWLKRRHVLRLPQLSPRLGDQERFLPIIGLLAGAGGGWILGAVLPIALWGLGDWLLTAPARVLHLAPRTGETPGGLAASPLPIWLLCGALLGGIWGVARLLRIKGVAWAYSGAWGLYAVLFLFAFLGAALLSG